MIAKLRGGSFRPLRRAGILPQLHGVHFRALFFHASLSLYMYSLNKGIFLFYFFFSHCLVGFSVLQVYNGYRFGLATLRLWAVSANFTLIITKCFVFNQLKHLSLFYLQTWKYRCFFICMASCFIWKYMIIYRWYSASKNLIIRWKWCVFEWRTILQNYI